MTSLLAPKLPISKKRASGKPASPSGAEAAAARKSSSNKKGGNKAWADYTPTPWMDYTPTPGGCNPWMTEGVMQPFMGMGMPPFMPPPGAEESMLFPATPTPNGCGGHFAFSHLDMMIPPPPYMGGGGLPLQPPPRILQIAATAAQAAHRAAAAAATANEISADAAEHYSRAHGEASAGLDESGGEAANYDDEQDAEDDFAIALAMVDHANLPSKGSAMHGTGKCRPCAWFWKPSKCQNEKDCVYCHLCPEGELKARKKSKVAALRMGALMPAASSRLGGGFAPCPGMAPPARVLKLSPVI